MQYNVLLIDDDPRVTSNLSVYIPWNELGYTTPEIAQNGTEAISIITSRPIHVALTDLSMPDIHGLDLIKRIRAISPRTEFIILSGYGTFEYAREAIALHTRFFLTKPTDLGEVTNAFRELKSVLDQNDRLLEAESLRDTSIINTLNVLFNDLRAGMPAPASLHYLLCKYDPLFNQVQYSLLCMHHPKNVSSQWLESSAKIAARHAGIHLFPITSLQTPLAYLFLNFEQNENLLTFLSDFSSSCKEADNNTIFFGLSTPCTNLEDLHGCFQQAEQALAEAVYRNKPYIIATISKEIITSNNKQPVEKAYDLLNQNKNEIIKAEATNLLGENWSLSNAVRLLLDVSELLIQEGHPVFIQWKGKSDKPVCSLEKEEINDWFLQRLQKLHQDLKETATSPKIRAIRQAREYIQAHFTEEISLEQVSDVINMSANYFSSVFYEVVGIRFIDYLTNLRIGKALDLLMNDENTIYMVCEATGYSNARYFSHVFGSVIGCTPSQFQHSYGRRKQ